MPLVLYEKEWDQAIISEERLYKEIAMSLGTLLDHEMMEAAHIIKYVITSLPILFFILFFEPFPIALA